MIYDESLVLMIKFRYEDKNSFLPDFLTPLHQQVPTCLPSHPVQPLDNSSSNDHFQKPRVENGINYRTKHIPPPLLYPIRANNTTPVYHNPFNQSNPLQPPTTPSFANFIGTRSSQSSPFPAGHFINKIPYNYGAVKSS